MGYTYPGTMTPLGGGRGWLDAAAAASILRIDRAIGHMLQITEAGRSFFQQEQHWLRYLRNGSPIALNPNTPSEHQKGKAIDSDEAQNFVAFMEEHGWFRTVYRWVGGKWTLVEWWHFEYFVERDKHRFDPAPASAGGSASPVPEEDEDMRLIGWNGRAWVVSDEKVAYVRNDRESLQMAKLLTKQPAATEITNDQLTELLFILAIPWAALDATFRSRAFDNESNWGKGTVWSRQIAEGHEDALRDASLARNLDDLAKSVTAG